LPSTSKGNAKPSGHKEGIQKFGEKGNDALQKELNNYMKGMHYCPKRK